MIESAISTLCLLIVAYQVNPEDFAKALKAFYCAYLFLAIASLACGYVLRKWRWSFWLIATAKAAILKNCPAPFLGSISLGNILSFHLGDVLRAIVFREEIGINNTTATKSLLVERLIGLITLVGYFGFGICTIQEAKISAFLAQSTLILVISAGSLFISVYLFGG